MKKIIPRPLTWLFLTVSLFLLSGCFETEFDFKTTVHPDGSVIRETQINGRGGHLFKIPTGPGWEAKAWETKGKETILADVYYHRVATGKFLPAQVIPPDYEFNGEDLAKKWDTDDKKHLEEAGIKPPYEQSLYSRNRIRVQRVKGLLTETFLYEEVFETAGLIELLTVDLKEEIKRRNQGREELLKEPEINDLIKLQLEDEYLAPIRFNSEVLLPGRIVSSNAQQTEKGKAVWKFSAKDFQKNYSTFTLRATSQTVSMIGMIFMILACGTGLLLLSLLGVGILKAKRKGPSKDKKKHLGKHDRGEIS